MNTTRTPFKKKAYLHELDYINKYNLTSIYNVPKLKLLNLKINCSSCGIHENDSFKFICYYVLYIYFLNVPKILHFTKDIVSNYKKLAGDRMSQQYLFLFTFSDLQEINNFLSKIFINKKDSYNKSSELHYTVSEIRKGSFSLFLNLPLFPDLKEIFLLLGKDIRADNIKMELTIKINGNFLSTPSDTKEYFLKNLPLFG